MVDVDKQVEYWSAGATEDLEVAGELMVKDRRRHALFIAHLALEKALKAHVCRALSDIAPKTHDLLRLSALAALERTEAQKQLLAEFGRYQLEGRYPEMLDPTPSRKEAEEQMARAGELFKWLMEAL